MEKKRFFWLAAAGLIVTRPVAALTPMIEAKLDAALSSARDEIRNEQPMVAEAGIQNLGDEFTARMY